MPPGRPIELTTRVAERVCAELRLGLSISSACAAAGIGVSTYHEWRARACEGPPFSDFADATTEARAQGTRGLEIVVRKAAATDWRAAGWMLERRAPDEWSRRTEVSGPAGGPVQIEQVRAAVDAELAGRSAADLGIPNDVLSADPRESGG